MLSNMTIIIIIDNTLSNTILSRIFGKKFPLKIILKLRHFYWIMIFIVLNEDVKIILYLNMIIKDKMLICLIKLVILILFCKIIKQEIF